MKWSYFFSDAFDTFTNWFSTLNFAPKKTSFSNCRTLDKHRMRAFPKTRIRLKIWGFSSFTYHLHKVEFMWDPGFMRCVIIFDNQVLNHYSFSPFSFSLLIYNTHNSLCLLQQYSCCMLKRLKELHVKVLDNGRTYTISDKVCQAKLNFVEHTPVRMIDIEIWLINCIFPSVDEQRFPCHPVWSDSGLQYWCPLPSSSERGTQVMVPAAKHHKVSSQR